MEGRRPIDKGKKRSTSAGAFKIVCYSGPDKDRNKSIELGVLFMCSFVCLYFYGVSKSIGSLPFPIPPRLVQTIGANVNMAHPEIQQPQLVLGNSASSSVSLIRNKIIDVDVPPTKWPVSIKEEDWNFETIIHPADGKTEMSVPKFWSRPVHNNRQFSRETAMKIGSCIEPDEDGNYARGDKCPKHQRTIFVSIASYRDFECRTTVESVFLGAKYPERIRVGKRWRNIIGHGAVVDDGLLLSRTVTV